MLVHVVAMTVVEELSVDALALFLPRSWVGQGLLVCTKDCEHLTRWGLRQP